MAVDETSGNGDSNDAEPAVKALDVAELLTWVREGQRYGLAGCEQLDEILTQWKLAGCSEATIYGIHRIVLAQLQTAWVLESLNQIGEALNESVKVDHE